MSPLVFTTQRPGLHRPASGCFSGCDKSCLRLECSECGDTIRISPWQIIFESDHEEDCIGKQLSSPGLNWHLEGRYTGDVRIGGKTYYYTQLMMECVYCPTKIRLRGILKGFCASCGTSHRVLVPLVCPHDIPVEV